MLTTCLLRNFQKVIQANAVNKSVKQRLKKRLGLPPARNIGSKDCQLFKNKTSLLLPPASCALSGDQSSHEEAGPSDESYQAYAYLASIPSQSNSADYGIFFWMLLLGATQQNLRLPMEARHLEAGPENPTHA